MEKLTGQFKVAVVSQSPPCGEDEVLQDSCTLHYLELLSVFPLSGMCRNHVANHSQVFSQIVL